MKIGNKEFDFKTNIYIMGILNVTPDSFSDGGEHFDTRESELIQKAVMHAKKMLDEGADIIDVGGESTRPGHQQVTDEEEIARIVPVIRALKKEIDAPISLDTYKANVAKAGIDSGADLINDIWGLKYDENMAHVIADAGVPCVLMQNRNEADYGELIEDVAMDLEESVRIARDAGIDKNKIILDPGIGFGKTYEDNLTTMAQLERLTQIGYPLLLGTSRKSMIGLTLDLDTDERVEGTIATSVIGLAKGCSIFRVHDVKENKRALEMAKAIFAAGDTGKDIGEGCAEDVISIKRQKVFAHHGVLSEEKKNGQDFYVSCNIRCNMSEAAKNDDLEKTINYAAVADTIDDFMTRQDFDLIETCAVRLAQEILREYRYSDSVWVKISKPAAPIGHEADDICVSAMRRRHTAFLAIGSNMGDKKGYLDRAVKDLSASPDVDVMSVSSFIETAAYGKEDQADFLNGAIKVATILEPDELLYLCHEIEKDAGRIRKERWGPRTLDIDIIFYDDAIIDKEGLMVPHPDMANRTFVLGPMAEIAPTMRHPISGKTMKEMYEALIVV